MEFKICARIFYRIGSGSNFKLIKASLAAQDDQTEEAEADDEGVDSHPMLEKLQANVWVAQKKQKSIEESKDDFKFECDLWLLKCAENMRQYFIVKILACALATLMQ